MASDGPNMKAFKARAKAGHCPGCRRALGKDRNARALLCGREACEAKYQQAYQLDLKAAAGVPPMRSVRKRVELAGLRRMQLQLECGHVLEVPRFDALRSPRRRHCTGCVQQAEAA